MPTYVYRCQQCNNHLEVIQKFSDAPLKVCPKCQGQLRRVIHATGIVFKGSGWYVNDSRSSSSTSKPAPKESDKSDKSGDIKTEASAAPAASETPKTESSSASKPASTSSD
jgi:putative FmdB family regulatory protein